jgi:formate dehydrogenase (NADP+) beta subunit
VDCLAILPDADEMTLRNGVKNPAVNLDQPFFVSAPLKHTARLMVKDENLCVHCGLCAERCPTAAWDMQKSRVILPYASDEEPGCPEKQRRSA